jgi:hypothetical protein
MVTQHLLPIGYSYGNRLYIPVLKLKKYQYLDMCSVDCCFCEIALKSKFMCIDPVQRRHHYHLVNKKHSSGRRCHNNKNLPSGRRCHNSKNHSSGRRCHNNKNLLPEERFLLLWHLLPEEWFLLL